MSELEQDEVKILFPEDKVGPYHFRPWSLEQFARLINTLVALVSVLVESGIKEEEFQSRFYELSPKLAPFLPEIIGVTLSMTPEEVEQIPVGYRMALGLRILVNVENAAQIKNFVTGLSGSSQSPAPSIP